MPLVVRHALISLLIMPLVLLPATAKADDGDDIRRLMMKTFDRQDAPLKIDPVTVRDDLAVAGWTQADAGGRALLRQSNGEWSLTFCGGDALKQAGFLRDQGMRAAAADQFAAEIAAAEARTDPSMVAQFSRFDGVIPMSGLSQR